MASSAGDFDFKALYQSSLKLTTAIDDFGIPRLEKGLEQLDDASRAFSQQQQTGKKRAAHSSDHHRTTGGATRRSTHNSNIDKANFLLAAKGIDAEKLARDLQAFELAPSFAPETPLGATDIESYLTHHHEMIILTTIDDVNRRTMAATHDRMNTAMIDDFERQKQRLLEDLGGAKALGIRNYPRVLTHDDRGNVFAALATAGDSSQRTPQLDAIGLVGSVGSRRLALGSSSNSRNARVDAPLRMSQLSAESALTDEMKLFARVIKELNASRVPHARSQFDLVGAFEHAAQHGVTASVTGTKAEPVLKCWQLLRDMVTGGNSRNSSSRLSERAFANVRRDASPELQFRLAFGARVFLESQFRAFVFQTVQKHALATGGVPDLVSNVRAFVQFLQRSRYAAPSSSNTNEQDDAATIDGDVGIWTLLYYCLRAGGDDEAIALATSAVRAGDSAVDAAVVTALTFRAQHKQQSRLRADTHDVSGASASATPAVAFSKAHPAAFTTLVKRLERLTTASIDAVGNVHPFERCVVNLLCLGNANASEARVLTTIEDYVWQRLCFIERSGAGGGSVDSNYSIARLAKSIQKFGPAHFEAAAKVDAATNSVGSFLYFELLLVTQAFELAVQFLATKGFLLDAVHFCLALQHYGLLRTSSSSSSNSMTDGEVEMLPDEAHGDVTMDVARLVRQFVHAFQRTNASDAAEYIACLEDPTTKRALLVELMLETRKFDALAGVTNSTDGCRTRGVLDRLLVDCTEHDVKELVVVAARKAELRGRPHDALALLKSAGDVEGVIELLTTQLSATLGATRTERDEWFHVAKGFCEHWLRFPWVQAIANRFVRPVAVAFQLLLNVCIFLELVETQQIDDAIRFVDELGVLPTAVGVAADSSSATSASVCVDRFLALDERVRQNFHLLLLGYVECLVRDTERVKAQCAAGETRRAAVRELRAKAEAVVTFAGMIKFRLPAGTMERLNRMESMIF